MAHVEKGYYIDPRVNMSNKFRKWISMIGATESTLLVTPASSGANNTTSNFDVRVTDTEFVVIDRSSMVIGQPTTITKTGPGTGTGNLYQPDCEGLRCRPLEKVLQNLNINVSAGSKLSYQPYL